MAKYRNSLFIFAMLVTNYVQADLFWENETEEDSSISNPEPKMIIPGNGRTIANHVKTSNTPETNKPLQPTISKPAPKKMLLPYDKSIRLRAPANNPTIDKNLRVSLQSNYMKEADRWYAAGGDVNSQDNQGRTLLNQAIQRHHTKGIEFLLLRHADVKKRNQNGQSGLQIAVFTGQARVVKMLLERGAVVSPMQNGDTMIHYALIKGMSSIAMDLLEKGVDVNKTYSGGKSLLHIAAAKSMINPAQALLNSGANVNATDNEGATPLHEAAAKGHTRIVHLLLGRNANIKAETDRKWRPIHHAARFGYSDIVSILLSKGASANDQTQSGKTPLSLAKHLHHQTVIDLLEPITTARNDSSSRSSRGGWFW